MSSTHLAAVPAWTWIAPVLASLLLALKFLHLVPAEATWFLVLAAGLLGAAVFAAVHHAEVLALKLGEPFGSILLAVGIFLMFYMGGYFRSAKAKSPGGSVEGDDE